MAIVVAESDIVETDLILMALVDGLPDDDYVLPAASVYGRKLGWLVIAPTGIYHLDIRDWPGAVWDRGAEPWLVEDEAGVQHPEPSPTTLLSDAREAISSFLADELPGMKPPLHGLLVLVGAVTEITTAAEQPFTPLPLAEAIEHMLAPAQEDDVLASPEQRETLAIAFDQRRLALRPRAAQPFELASGERPRDKQIAWTVEEVLRLLDRYTQPAIQHLQSGALERWLDSEGAWRLADLAQQALQRYPADGRAALEWFMLSSGYVQPPTITVKPERLQMGYVLKGQSASRTLKIGVSQKTGYPLGQVEPADAWVAVEPETFSGQAQVLITVDASTLPAGTQQHAEVVINAIAENCPLTIPITVHVRAAPTRLGRLLLRLLLGLVAGAAIGGALGMLADILIAASPLATAVLPATVCALLLWGLMGIVYGALPRPAWPAWYALRHWLRNVLLWGIGGGLAVLALSALASHLISGVAWAQAAWPNWQANLATWLVLAVIPGTVVEAAQAQVAQQGDAPVAEDVKPPRPILRGCVVVALLVATVLGLHALRISTGISAEGAPSWQVRAESLWQSFETKLNGYVDGLYLRYYEEQKSGKAKGLDAVRDWITGER